MIRNSELRGKEPRDLRQISQRAGKVESRLKQSFKFPKRERLRKKRDFQVLLARGKSFQVKGIRFKYLPNRLEHSRLGLAVSRKVGKATRRNRIRRLLREGYRLTKGDFPFPIDLVAIADRGEELSFQKALEAFQELAKHLRKMDRAERCGEAEVDRR